MHLAGPWVLLMSLMSLCLYMYFVNPCWIVSGTLHACVAPYPSIACRAIAHTFSSPTLDRLRGSDMLHVGVVSCPSNHVSLCTLPSNALGRAIGFFLGPALVHTSTDLPRLLYVNVAFAALPCLAAWVYLPPFPAAPPSSAAAVEAARWSANSREWARTVAAGPVGYQLGLSGALGQVRATTPPNACCAVHVGCSAGGGRRWCAHSLFMRVTHLMSADTGWCW